MMTFAEKLMTLRKARGLSQSELGAEIGVSRQTVSKWELGQSYPDFERLVRLSDYFECSLDALVKDLDVTPVREGNHHAQETHQIYNDLQSAKSVFNVIFNTFAIIGVVGILFFIGMGLLWG